jgi:hypothetical protein
LKDVVHLLRPHHSGDPGYIAIANPRRISLEPSALRHEILQKIKVHEETGSSSYLDDKEIAVALGLPVPDIQRQLLVLEDDDRVELAKAFGPSFGARLRPKGMRALETPE